MEVMLSDPSLYRQTEQIPSDSQVKSVLPCLPQLSFVLVLLFSPPLLMIF